MKVLERVITLPSRDGAFRLIPFGCLHSDNEGHRKNLWDQCKAELLKPDTYGIGAGDYRDLLRTTAMRYLQGYRQDSTSMKTLDDMVRESTIDFYHEYFKGLESKIIGLGRGNHMYEYRDGTNDNQQLCQLLNVPYLDNPSFIRLVIKTPDGKTRNTLRLIMHHGNWGGGHSRVGGDVNSAETKAAGFDFDIYVFSHCFDDQTEILTPTGWKKHHELLIGSPVATYNQAQDCLEWQPCEDITRWTHFDEMYVLDGHNTNFAVTAEHGLWAAPYNGHGKCHNWTRLTAQEAFGRRLRFKLAAKHNEDKLPLTESWVRLLAWIMAEGSIIHASKGKFHGVVIGQSEAPDGRMQKLEQVISACGLEYTKKLTIKAGTLCSTTHAAFKKYKLNFDHYKLYLRHPKEYRDIIQQYLDLSKTPSSLLRRMSYAQMLAFLDAYVTADGSFNRNSPGSRQVASQRKDHIDFLQELACRTGHRSSISSHGGMYYLTFNVRDTALVSSKSWSKKPYSGIAWCPTVKNGMVVIRRAGKTCITFQTHRKWAMHIPTLTIPRIGTLEVVERPRCFIRTGCFVAGYDKKCGDGNYVQDKLMHPSDLGFVTLTVKFYREYDSEAYKRSRLRDPRKLTKNSGSSGRDKYKFSVTF